MFKFVLGSGGRLYLNFPPQMRTVGLNLKPDGYRNTSCVGSPVEFVEMLWLGTARTNDQIQRRSGYRQGPNRT